MRIGLKLDIGFSENEDYRALFGHHRILDHLRGLGITLVETPMGVNTDEGSWRRHLWQCSEAGMLVSLHPYTEATPANSACFAESADNECVRTHERFFSWAAAAAEAQQEETVVVLHSAAGKEVREDLLARSIAFFDWAGRWCRENAPDVRVAAELQISPNPDQDIRRIGDRWGELQAIAENSGVGICWDFGHTVMNARRSGLPLEPPADLLPRMAHVHCHDVSREDHQPLIFGAVPWQRFLRSLRTAEFNGTIILEIPARQFLVAGGLDTLHRSVAALQTFLRKLGPLQA
jgi:sugar phosphate isomerase/epimerase